MARIYVSSTFNDLQNHREAVRLTLRQLGHQDIAMEYYGATDERPLDKCLQDVASCDVYVGIFAWRYGFIPDNQAKSITELEYQQATATGKPRLIFLSDDKAGWPPVNLIEFPAHAKMKALRDELATTHVVSFFSSIDSLKAVVAQAVSTWERNQAAFSEERVASANYEQLYREQLATRYGYVTPPIYNAERRKLPLDSLYVLPKFSAPDLNQPFSVEEFTRQISRTVLLGHPGSGKSTFAYKVSVDLATRYPEHLIGEQARTPILVIVREYGIEKQRSNCSILDFVTFKANADYQARPPNGLFSNLLSAGQAAVVFDGLDELVETSDRQAITRDIEAFCHVYPTVPVLITSRVVGYEEAPLDKNVFKVYSLAEFEPPQIREYAQKWFASETEKTDNEQMLAAFLTDLEAISPELKSSPLLLALLCSLYRGEGYIPRNKADVYEKCSELLFDRRDKERGIKPDISFEAQLRPTMRYLAFWIYQDNVLQTGVTERKLIGHATDYLLGKRFEDRDDAEHAARNFIRFCTGRAWVFTDSGTTKDGERIYQFTHRTFLEFFAAEYLAHTHRTVDELLTVLLPHLIHGEWSEVAQLAFQKMGRNSQGIDDELLTALLTKSKDYTEQDTENILSFALRSLEFITPKPSLVRQLMTTCIQRCIDVALAEIKEAIAVEELKINEVYTGHFSSERDQFIWNFIHALASVAADNRITVGMVLQETLSGYIRTDNGYAALVAAELGLNLDNADWNPRDPTGNREVRRFYREVSQRIFDACIEHIIMDLCPKYVRVALDVYQMGGISLQELIHLHSPQVVFQEYHYLLYRHLYDGEFVVDVLSDFCTDKTTPHDDVECIKLFQELADALLPLPTPWMTVIDDSSFSYVTMCQRELPNLDSKALFGIFICIAYIYERVNGDYHSSERFENFLPTYFQAILKARNDDGIFDDETAQNIEMEFQKCGFSDAQKEFIREWIDGPIIITT